MDETFENKITLSETDTELLKRALAEAAEQASVPPAGGTTQFVRKKAELTVKSTTPTSGPSASRKLI